MSTEANKALVQQFVEEFWSSGNVAVADKMVATDATIYVNNQEVTDIDTFKALARSIRTAFPDWYSTVEELVAEGDKVAERWTGHGTHQGEFQGISATGRRVAVPGTVFYRIAEGRIVEFRGQFDRMSMMEQLGVLPTPSEA
jgi:steroid delta-isomerase-like uncharacterized protein